MIKNIEYIKSLNLEQLEKLFDSGSKPDIETIYGEYAGYNTTPLAGLIGVRYFIKHFYSDNLPMGRNIQIQQKTGIDYNKKLNRKSEPKTQGYFYLRDTEAPKHPNAIVIDYSHPANPFFEPGRLLVDYVTKLENDLLLGVAYLKNTNFKISYFLLQPIK